LSAISVDGRFITFVSDAPNLVPGDNNFTDDVFRFDVQTGRSSASAWPTGGAESVATPAVARSATTAGWIRFFEQWR